MELVLWWPGLHWMLSEASSLLCGCHSPVGTRDCSLVVGVEAPRSVSELCFWAMVWGEQDWSTAIGRAAPEYSSARAVHWVVCYAVSPVTCHAGLQSTVLLALPLTQPQLWECQQLALIFLRHFFHKATSTDPLKSGPRTIVVAHLDPLWELWRQPRSWPSPAPTCIHPQSPQLLKPDPS